jgi:hypothetical protein
MDCSVCCDSTRTFPEYRVASCSHGADVCNDCHRNFLRTSTALVTNGTSGEIQFACMTRGCTLSGGYTTDALFRLFTERSARDALFERLAHACFERMTNAVYCTRPQCASLLTYEVSADAPVCTSIVCRRCANAICLTCKRDAHDGVSCADYEETHTSAGWTSEKLINAISRRCPQCTFRIFRQGGCPQMTCSRCAFQFCYGCLGDRATYRAGAHEGCDRIATQFELDGMRVLVDVRNAERAAERAARREARIAEQSARRAAMRAERDRAEAAISIFSDDEEDDGFDAFAAFAGLSEPAETEVAAVVTDVVDVVVESQQQESQSTSIPSRSVMELESLLAAELLELRLSFCLREV